MADSNAGNSVIVYFSRTGENYTVGEIEVGNTDKVAAELAKQTGAPRIEIVPVEPYPYVYNQAVAQATRERNDQVRPAFTLKSDTAGTDALAALDAADTVYLGYPIWWADMPMSVYTFLESRDWAGVTIRPFCTHEGSGLADTVVSIADVTGANVLPGLAIRGATAQNDEVRTTQRVADWLV